MGSWEDAWQPLVDAVGTDFGGGVVIEAPDCVEAGAVRKFVEPLEFDCPLHLDRALARAHGLPDVAAPASSIVSFTIQPLWRSGDPPVFTVADPDAQPARTSLGPRLTGLEPPTKGYFATDSAVDYLRAVVVGDRLSRVGHRLVACTPKQTRLGRGAFATWESEVHNHRHELVARLRTSSYAYDPLPAEASPRPSPPPPLPAPPAPGPFDWRRQRCWEDLRVDEAVPAVAFPLSVYRLVMAAGSNRDFNSIHHNTSWARSTGAPDMYANTLFLQGMWERTVRQFIGLDGTIRSVSGFRMSSFNIVGDTVVVRGAVRRTWQEGDVGLAELSVWSENRYGVSVGPGTVVVALPKRG